MKIVCDSELNTFVKDRSVAHLLFCLEQIKTDQPINSTKDYGI